MIKKIFLFFSFSIFLFGQKQNDKVLAGPMVSYTDGYSTQIWMLLDPDAKLVNVEVKNYDNDKFRNYEFEVKNPHNFKDFIPVTLPIESLIPNMEFTLNLFVDSVPVNNGQVDIFTKRPHLDDTHFLIGGDITNINDQTDNIFSSMISKNSDFMVWIGDNINSDISGEEITFDDLVDKYVATRMNPQINKFIKSIPHIATWDDLDYGLINGGTNWGLKDSVFYAFDMFWPNALNKTYNYTFWDYGTYQKYSYNDIEVFLLDNRMFREDLNDPTPSLFGDTQIERLFKEINNNGAAFTFIVSPSPFLFETEESLINYKDHFEHFMYRLKVSGTEGVILLSGNGNETKVKKHHIDPEWSGTDYWYPIYELNLGSIANSNNSQNYSRIRIEGELHKRVCSIETFDSTGNIVFRKRIHEDELKF